MGLCFIKIFFDEMEPLKLIFHQRLKAWKLVSKRVLGYYVGKLWWRFFFQAMLNKKFKGIISDSVCNFFVGTISLFLLRAFRC